MHEKSIFLSILEELTRILFQVMVSFKWIFQLGHFIENDTIEIQNDTIELCRRGEDALFFRHQMTFSAEKIIEYSFVH